MQAVALCGLPGCGKSTLARALAAVTSWRRLDRDEMRLASAGLGHEAADKRLLGEMMRTAMQCSLLRGESVILDGMTFSRKGERARFRESAERSGAAWRLVWLDCPAALARERILLDRNHPAADRDPALVDAVLARFEPPLDGLRLDARRPPEELVAECLGYLPGEKP